MDAEQAIHSFWSSFGLTAYDENSVPDTAELPYITYSLSYDTFGNQVSMSASIWDRSSSWIYLTNKAKEISQAISYGGIVLDTNEGYIKIYRNSPFYNRMSEGETQIKRILISIQAEYFTVD